MQRDVDKTPSVSTISPALVRALRRLLRPLIKLMLAKGITYNYLIDLLKEIFVEVGDKEFNIDKQTSTDSYLSLLTGIHRKDIKRLRENVDEQTAAIPESVTLGARLVGLWTSDSRYLDEHDQPKPLPRFIKEGGECSFEGLVTSVSSDIRSRVMLDEWLRLGVVYFNDQRHVCLNVSAFVPSKAFDEKAYYLGHNLADHTAAAASNLLSEEKAFLERCVHYNALSEESIKILTEQSESLGMQSLLEINKKAIACEKSDAKKNMARHRMTFGIYFYSEPVERQNSKTDAKIPVKNKTVK